MRESNFRRLSWVAQLAVVALLVASLAEWVQVLRGRFHLRVDVQLTLWLAVGISTLTSGMLRKTEWSADRRLLLARAWVFALCLCMAYIECLFWPNTPGKLPGGLSRVCLAVVVSPVLIPDTLRRSVSFSVSLLSTILLAHFLSAGAGHILYSVVDLLTILLSQLEAVAVAWFAAATVHQLREALSQDYGSYRMLRKMSVGGYGEVWEAYHTLLRRPAAIKIIRADLTDDEMQERFEREAETLSLLECPHTVRLYDYGHNENGELYLAMEMLKGMDLEQLVQRHGPLPEERVTSLLAQACLALEEAHLCGLIHRDIKPANLYLCQVGMESDFIKVIDFGLAKPDQKSTLTTEHQMLGTVDYMSPEQIQTKPLDGRADLYSLGALGYYLLTGTTVFIHPSMGLTILGHLEQQPETPSQRCGHTINPRLEKLIMKCLAKDPDDRPGSARALYERLVELPTWTRAQSSQWWATHGTIS